MYSGTTFLLFVVIGIWIGYALLGRFRPPRNARKAAKRKMWATFYTVYVCLFAYPIIAVKIVDAFGCHEVEGVFYLRADYSIECYTSRWYDNAAYAVIWIVVFVLLFPLFIFMKLWSYQFPDSAINRARKRIGRRIIACCQAKGGASTGSSLFFSKSKSIKRTKENEKKHTKEVVNFSFLMDDYKPTAPAVFWESIETARKLLLCVIGAFWPTKSLMCVATALLVSVFFQLLHEHYLPYKSEVCNRLQSVSLAIMSLIYFVGVLLKSQHITEQSEYSVGVLLVVMVVLMLLSALWALGYGAWQAYLWVQEVKYIKQEAADNPLFDPKLHEHIIDLDTIKLEEQLGSGAQAAVFKGKLGGSADVAIKVAAISQTMGSHEELHSLLMEEQREAQMLLPLRHPHVVVIYGIAIDVDDRKFEIKVMTVLELCKYSLDDDIKDKRHPMSWQQRLERCCQMAQGMHFLHSKRIYHRDLKPANVLIGKDNIVKLADFGLSMRVQSPSDDGAKPHLRRHGAALSDEALGHTTNIGTPTYMAVSLVLPCAHARHCSQHCLLVRCCCL